MGVAPPIISKIEHPLGIENLSEILEASDAVMVARGDLGVEVSPERVPLLQKRIITQANEVGLPVITATQMLESMVERPVPTRAEASDVANAILDGTDAVMLSAETAIGAYPVQTVETMARIALQAEAAESPRHPRHRQEQAYAMAEAACFLAENLKARAMVVVTGTGRTAKTLSHQRPAVPIYAFTPELAVCRNLYALVRRLAHSDHHRRPLGGDRGVGPHPARDMRRRRPRRPRRLLRDNPRPHRDRAQPHQRADGRPSMNISPSPASQRPMPRRLLVLDAARG